MENLPQISICMPIFNRNKFKELILCNLKNLDYPKHLLEFVMDDDGNNEKFINNENTLEDFKKSIFPIKFNYKYNIKKRSIGEKRNNLVKMSSYKIIAFMDSDDIYFPSYLKYSLSIMKEKNYGLVGSNKMIFVYPKDNWLITGINCESKRQIHEATMIFTKKYHRSMGGFNNNSRGEGAKIIDGMNEKFIGITKIEKCMLCLVHNDNTLPKDMFKKAQVIDATISPIHKSIIEKIIN